MAVWVALGVMLLGGTAWAVDGQIWIAQTANTIFPIPITQSGSHVLTTNLEVPPLNTGGIRVDADDVTIDLNGHTIAGSHEAPSHKAASGRNQKVYPPNDVSPDVRRLAVLLCLRRSAPRGVEQASRGHPLSASSGEQLKCMVFS